MNSRSGSGDLPIVFENVTVLAGKVTILDHVSISTPAGPPTAVIGPNGSGKTTFLRVAMGLVAPSVGRITWGGQDVSPLSRMALMFQRPVMLRRSVTANLTYALAAARIPRDQYGARVAELLSLVGLRDLGSRPARRLSGGEQQRLALARALARDPGILFLDEPTASLDPAASKAIEDIVRATSARGVKVIMATHDLAEAKRVAGEIILLHRGAVIESGSAERFFTGPESEAGRKFIAGELMV